MSKDQRTGGYQEAMRWYRLSAEQGDADAQNNLGVMYDNPPWFVSIHRICLRQILKAGKR